MALEEDRLGKLATLAERSGNDGEAVNALRALSRALEAKGTSLSEVVKIGMASLPRDAGKAPAREAKAPGAAGGRDVRPGPSKDPTEVVVTAAKLPGPFKGRFEILEEGLSKGKKPMAHVKITISQSFDDKLSNTVRVTYPLAFWEVMTDLKALIGRPCVFTLKKGSPAGEPDAIASLSHA